MERTKAIVKFFSQEPIENVMVMMKYMPERVIFLGHKDNMITKQIRDIEQFRDHKYPDVELEFIEVPKDDLDNIIGTLAGIIREYPGIRFALTGGSEMLLIALGCISARMEVSKLRIDPFTGKEIDVRGSKVITSDYHSISVLRKISCCMAVCSRRRREVSPSGNLPISSGRISGLCGICAVDTVEIGTNIVESLTNFARTHRTSGKVGVSYTSISLAMPSVCCGICMRLACSRITKNTGKK